MAAAVGGLYLLAGLGLLVAASVSAPGSRRPVRVGAHALAGLPLVWLALSAAAVGGWTGLTVYATLGPGTITAPWLAAPGRRILPAGSALFALVVGLSGALIGATMLAAPTQYGSSIFDPVRPHLAWYGAAFLGGGLLVLAAQLRSGLPRWLVWGGHLLLGGAMFLFGPPVLAPNRAFTTLVYYNGLGALLALLPWLGPWVERAERRSLRARVALALAVAAGLPLVVTMGVASDRQEQLAASQVQARQRSLTAWPASPACRASARAWWSTGRPR